MSAPFAQYAHEPRPQINFSALAFFQQMQEKYKALWRILGREWTTLLDEAAWASRAIPGPNHGSIKYPLTAEQKKAMLPILAEMTFFRALKLPPGVYDELDPTGAKWAGVLQRIIAIVENYLKPSATESDANKRYSFRRITCHVGMRPRQIVLKDGTTMDGRVEDIIEQLSPNVLKNAWVQSELLKLKDPRPQATSDEDRDLWWGPFATECLLMVLAWIIAYDGDVEVVDYELIDEEQMFPEVPARTFASITLRLPDGTEVLVLNAPAVERPHGAPRPTTASITEYWLKHYSPPLGAKIVCVSGPTHGYRVSRDFESKMHAVRPDLTVFGVSRAAAKPMDVFNNALAEAVWLLVKAFEEVNVLLPAEMREIQNWRFELIQERTVKEIEEFLRRHAEEELLVS